MLSDRDQERLQRMLDAIEPEIAGLNGWERGFCRDQIERWKKWGPDMRLSLKQWGILTRIYEDLAGSDKEPAPIDEEILY